MDIFRYYLTYRYGALPQCCLAIHDCRGMTYFNQIQREAYGWVEYDRELSEEDKNTYGLIGPEIRTI